MPAVSARVDANGLEVAHALAAEICARHRGHLRELTILEADGGVILHGRASTFYGKQMALHEVRRGNLIVLANRVVVG